jgi:hypothetical protein
MWWNTSFERKIKVLKPLPHGGEVPCGKPQSVYEEGFFKSVLT